MKMSDKPKLRRVRTLNLTLKGAPSVTYCEEDYVIISSPGGVNVNSRDGLTDFYYPMANIIEYKISITLFDEEGHQCYNEEGFHD